jgi:O-antigen/teichoic acid export membrane protein
MAFRGLALASRFALSLYVIHYIDIASLGIFGLITGIAGMMPAALGFGINYHLNRDIMLMPRDEARTATRDRLLVSTTMLALVWIGGAAIYVWVPDLLGPYPLIVGLIISMETIATDIHVIIINRGHAIFANILLFIRSASWIFPVVGLGLAFPAARTLLAIFIAWFSALVVSGVICILFFSPGFSRSFWLKKPNVAAILSRARINPLIYVNDIGLVGQTYLDRFLVFWLLGGDATGLYTFVFSLTNGIYVLVHVSTVQVALPSLSRMLDDFSEWRSVLTGYIRQAIAFGLCIAVCIVLMMAYALPKMNSHQLSDQKLFFVLMSIAAVIKPVSDLFNVGLYSLRRDHMVAVLNIGAIIFGAGLSVTAIEFFDLRGVGLASVFAVILVGSARSIASGYWRHPTFRPLA